MMVLASVGKATNPEAVFQPHPSHVVTMRLSVLGTDVDVLLLIKAARSRGHEVTWISDVREEDASAVRQVLPNLSAGHNWESLLEPGFTDVVLVGKGSASNEDRFERIKRLTAEAIPLLLVHTLGTSVLPYYELDMMRREHASPLLHFPPHCKGPFLDQLAGYLGDGHPLVGPIYQLNCERTLSDTARETVLTHLAADFEVLHHVVGDVSSVSAMGPVVGSQSYATLQIQMYGQFGGTIHWRLVPASLSRGLQATLVGQYGQLVLSVPSATEDAEWRLTTIVDDQPPTVEVANWSAADAAVKQLERIVANNGDTLSTWESATKAMEVIDSVELSLQKGQTIDIHHQVLTESVAFKGVMSALGCGILVIGMLAVMAVGMLGDVAGLSIMRFWPWAILAVLGGFLLLPLISWLSSSSSKSGRTE